MTTTPHQPARDLRDLLLPGLLLVTILFGVGSAAFSLVGGPRVRWVDPPVGTSPTEQAFGPVASEVLVGESGGVVGAFVGKTYVVVNTSQPRATLTTLADLPGGTGDFRISAQVAVVDTQAPDGGAGIVFVRDRSSGTYMAAAITGDGSVSVFEGSPDGLALVTSVKTEGLLKPGFNELVATRVGGEVTIKVNGKQVSSHSGGYVAASDEAGLFTNGLGRFTYAGFKPQMRAPKS